MENLTIIPLLFILGGFFASGFFKVKAFGVLNAEQRQVVVQLAAQFQRKLLLFAGLLVVLLIVLGRVKPEFSSMALVGVLGILLLYHIAIVVWSLTQLKNYNLPTQYMRLYQTSELVKLGGIAAFVLFIAIVQ